MVKFKKNNYMFWHSPVALVFLFCILILFGYKLIDLFQKKNETNHKKELILDKIETLQKKESALSTDISKIKTEEGIEEIIREKFQVAKPKEKMVIIIDENIKDNTLPEKEIKSRGLGNFIKKLFTN